jgi:hypothetical protein
MSEQVTLLPVEAADITILLEGHPRSCRLAHRGLYPDQCRHAPALRLNREGGRSVFF